MMEMSTIGNYDLTQVFVAIIEQPERDSLRFRNSQDTEFIRGVCSTLDKITFPKIQLFGYHGRALVLVSCVTESAPYKPHPHNLVGNKHCRQGVCSFPFENEEMICEFANMKIQYVESQDIGASLTARECIRTDPFNTGFEHKNRPASIDLNVVRLCFQVFLRDPVYGMYDVRVKPVVSDPIVDKDEALAQNFIQFI